MTDQEKESYAKSTNNDTSTDTTTNCNVTPATKADVVPNKEVPKEPQYVIKYRYDQSDVPTIRGDTDPCRPTSILVEVSLPEMSSAKGIELDVLEHLLTLESKVNSFFYSESVNETFIF